MPVFPLLFFGLLVPVESWHTLSPGPLETASCFILLFFSCAFNPDSCPFLPRLPFKGSNIRSSAGHLYL